MKHLKTAWCDFISLYFALLILNTIMVILPKKLYNTQHLQYHPHFSYLIYARFLDRPISFSASEIALLG